VNTDDGLVQRSLALSRRKISFVLWARSVDRHKSGDAGLRSVLIDIVEYKHADVFPGAGRNFFARPGATIFAN
jgi:hypothetical protein